MPRPLRKPRANTRIPQLASSQDAQNPGAEFCAPRKFLGIWSTTLHHERNAAHIRNGGGMNGGRGGPGSRLRALSRDVARIRASRYPMVVARSIIERLRGSLAANTVGNEYQEKNERRQPHRCYTYRRKRAAELAHSAQRRPEESASLDY